jgi:hypothetical protein
MSYQVSMRSVWSETYLSSGIFLGGPVSNHSHGEQFAYKSSRLADAHQPGIQLAVPLELKIVYQ